MKKSVRFCVGVARLAGYVLSLGVFVSTAHADYRSAVTAYLEKDYDKAYRELRELAELGHADSQLALGSMYYNGEGVSKNYMLAYGWIKMAADNGSKKAIELEPRVRNSIDAENVERARGLLANYTPSAINNRLLPKILENCEYQDISPAVALKLRPLPEYPLHLRNSNLQGSVLVEMMIAADGTVRDVRVIQALPEDVFDEYVRKAVLKWKYLPAKRGSAPIASTTMTMFNFVLTNAAGSLKLSAYLEDLRKQADDGNPSAQYYYGLVLSGYPTYRKPWSEVLPWLLRSAQGGFADAQYQVGRSLSLGRGCQADSIKAREWFHLAAAQDQADAQIELARLALKVGPTYEPQKAVFWLERAAKGDNVKAKKYLASVLATSPIESLRDPKRALELIKLVLKQEKGDAVALEIQAAALAANGEYDAAIAAEERALKLAKSYEWNTEELSERLKLYRANKSWQGELLIF